jgi:hypothetical protein
LEQTSAVAFPHTLSFVQLIAKLNGQVPIVKRVHGYLNPLVQIEQQSFDRTVKDLVQLFALNRIEGFKHMVDDLVTIDRSPDPELAADEIAVAEHLANMSDTVMPAMTAATFKLELPKRQIDIVMNHNQIPRINSEGFDGGTNTCSTKIHECLWQKNSGFNAIATADAVFGLMAFLVQQDAAPG